MAVITTILRSIRDQLARVPWLRQAVPQMMGPWVDTVNPLAGWLGTIVEMSGAGFSSVLDNNVVQVGGASALVLEGSGSRLLVLAGPATTSGPVTVTVSGTTVTGSELFTVLPYPALDDLSSDGSPVIIDGPVAGDATYGDAEPAGPGRVRRTDRSPSRGWRCGSATLRRGGSQWLALSC
jgi:IPT/TIG domain-containing protein